MNSASPGGSIGNTGQTPPWVQVIPIASCRGGAGVFVERDGLELAVFLLEPNEAHVIDNACPHSGGNLSAGQVRDAIVTCPLHEWKFRLVTGLCVDTAAVSVRRYPARIRDGWVEIQIDG